VRKSFPLSDAYSSPSRGFTCTFTNTLDTDTDLVWAAATGLTERDAAIPMHFAHAMACIEVEIVVPAAGAGRMEVKKIEAKTGTTPVNLAGTFTVDNTLVVPEGRWSNLTPGLYNGVLWQGTASYAIGSGETSMLGKTTGTVLAGAGLLFPGQGGPDSSHGGMIMPHDGSDGNINGG
jgi:hypothetical protein